MNYLSIKDPFQLESGAVLPELNIAYTTYGRPTAEQDNIVWICHALTANADPAEWWPGLVGEGKLFDPAKHYIICANMLGSCYGSSGPASIDPNTGRPYRLSFPLVTIRDMVRAHQYLQRYLGITRIHLIIGGSMGGQQALEWAVSDPGLFDHLCVLASNARHSPWGIAFNEAQRMAVEADPSLHGDEPGAGARGLEAARAVAMLSYRSYASYKQTQSENSDEPLDHFRASSYQRYQGHKLQRRFDAFSYLTLSKAMDSHHVGRGRGGVAEALKSIQARTLVIGIQSDLLFPVEEQAAIAAHLPGAHLEVIDSLYGHDGFLIESAQIQPLVERFLAGNPKIAPGALNGYAKEKKTALPGSERF